MKQTELLLRVKMIHHGVKDIYPRCTMCKQMMIDINQHVADVIGDNEIDIAYEGASEEQIREEEYTRNHLRWEQRKRAGVAQGGGEIR